VSVRAGTKFGAFEISSLLGVGGMGEVYLAEDTRLGRRVALKLLASKLTHDDSRVRRFEQEARLASALNHPNIVTIHEVGQCEHGRYIVMEFVEGSTLRARLRDRIPLRDVSHYGGQIARALTVAHAAGIVHRDIKPENVIVRGDGYVKVVDFGLVRLLPEERASRSGEGFATIIASPTAPDFEIAHEETGVGTLVGTVHYMSPEQARGEPATCASDLFSLGVLLYEMITDRRPFEAASALEVMQAIISQAALSPSHWVPDLPAELGFLILQMLEKDPRLRPTAEDVVGRLEQLARETDTVGVVPRARRLNRHVVGRSGELRSLWSAWESVSAGRGLLVCVTGEPGIGKSTLVDDFLEALRTAKRSCYVGRGRCSERLAGSEAYLPILEVLESMIHGDPTGTVSRAMKLLAPTWYVQIAPLAGDSDASRLAENVRVASQERLKREFGAFLAEISRTQPVLVNIDDLHWSDIATVDLLAYLATKFDSTRILILATLRPTDLLLQKHAFAEVKLELQGRGVCQEISLGFLNRDEIAEYLALEYREHCFPAKLTDVIHARTDGSPLFMVDLVRYLRDREVIVQVDGKWNLAQSITDIQDKLPESVRSMAERKIAQVNDEERRLLLAASVQGHEFDAAVVAEMLGLDPTDVEECLEPLDRIHALVAPIREHELPDATLTVRYSFVHSLYQNTLYGSLKPARRTQLCRAAAGALLKFYAGHENDIASQLALLFETARDYEKASDFYLKAARNAAALYANEEAVELSRRSIANAQKLPAEVSRPRVVAAASNRAQYLMTLSRFEEAGEDYELAEKTAHEAADPDAQISALCGAAMVAFNLKRLGKMRKKANQALDLARKTNTPVGIASAEAISATERTCSGALDEAEILFDRAIPVLKQSAVPLHALEAVSYRGMLYAWKLQYDEAQVLYQWAIARAKEQGACFHIVANLFVSGMALGNQGRISEALDACREAMRLAEVNGDRYWLPRLPNTVGWLHRELQDWETALRLDGENVGLAKEMQMPEGEANSHVNLAHDFLSLGELDRALDHLQQADRIYQQDVWYRWRYNLRLQSELARHAILCGDLPRGTSHAENCLSNAVRTQAPKYVAWSHKLLGEIAMMEDRAEDAEREFGMALATTSQYRCPTIEWKILAAAADLSGQRKDSARRDELMGRARNVIKSLADSVHEDRLRELFVGSEVIRSLKN
jgi:tetratricopeptide (TPR) repeat protein